MSSDHPEAAAAVATLARIIVAVVAMWGGAQLAHLTAHASRPAANPAALVFAVAGDRYHWTLAATLWASVEGVLLVAVLGRRDRRSPQ
jgi:hypothetical protein